ncbi:hypothetical protein Salat_0938300 [Sesamum alatum]|uniref:Uncharacterized protein n=1 Tax=Sesamum alatum TaxID=300844 RepID=A0AAE2CRG4_9LAMI|nr:hypothetical protein Salat_0938300 [Sesamum alatum]
MIFFLVAQVVTVVGLRQCVSSNVSLPVEIQPGGELSPTRRGGIGNLESYSHLKVSPTITPPNKDENSPLLQFPSQETFLQSKPFKRGSGQGLRGWGQRIWY